MKSLQLVNKSLQGDYPKVDADLTCGQSGAQTFLRTTFILWYVMAMNNSFLSLKGCGPQNKSASESSLRECEPHSQPYTHICTPPRVFLCSVATRTFLQPSGNNGRGRAEPPPAECCFHSMGFFYFVFGMKSVKEGPG